MRGDSLRDFYAKSLALLGLAFLGALGAAVDYWPTNLSIPRTSEFDFQIATLCHPNQRFRLPGCDGERFFQIDIASGFEALSGKRIMALWRSSDMNDIRCSRFQQFLEIGETRVDPEPLPKLSSH